MSVDIVTGANGFVGTALCRELSSRGHEVMAVVRDERSDVSRIDGIPGLRVSVCEMSDYGHLAEAVDGCGWDAMYHLAWAGLTGRARADPDVQVANVRGACLAAQACVKLGVGRLVFASSIHELEAAAIATSGREVPAGHLYSVAKRAACDMARVIAGAGGVAFVRAVISNAYGPGEVSDRLVSSSVRRMLAGERCAFTTGEQTYDFVYVDDCARALADMGERGRPGASYYVGSCEPRPLREYLLAMRDAVDPSLEIGLGEIPFHGASPSYEKLDMGALRRDTGFVASVGFPEGIRRTVAWARSQQRGAV